MDVIMEELASEHGRLWSCVQGHMLHMKGCVDTLEKEKAQLQEMCETLLEENKRLKDDNKSFMSVSRIVALTNENAKLTDKVKFLEGVIARRPSASPPPLATPVLQHSVETPATSKPAVGLVEFLEKEETPVAPLDETAAVITEEADEAVPAAETTKEEEENEVEEEGAETEELFETTIKGKAYFMTNSGKIYEFLDEGEVGNYIGDYVTGKGGKKKVVWH